MTVYHDLDPQLQLSLVPIVQNCAVHPMMPLRGAMSSGLRWSRRSAATTGWTGWR